MIIDTSKVACWVATNEAVMLTTLALLGRQSFVDEWLNITAESRYKSRHRLAEFTERVIRNAERKAAQASTGTAPT